MVGIRLLLPFAPASVVSVFNFAPAPTQATAFVVPPLGSEQFQAAPLSSPIKSTPTANAFPASASGPDRLKAALETASRIGVGDRRTCDPHPRDHSPS